MSFIPVQLGGQAIAKSITQTAHGFTVGQWVYLVGTTYTLTDADSGNSSDSVGVVSIITDVNTFTIVTDGYVNGLTGLTAGTRYYLSTTAGAITTTTPISNIKAVFIADSTTSGWVQQYAVGTSADWIITGNAGTVEATNFIGASDNIGLSLRTNNIIRQTITNAGNIGIGVTTPATLLHVGTPTINTTAITAEGESFSATPSQIVVRGLLDNNQQMVIGYNTTDDYGALQAIYQGLGTRPLSLNPAGGNVGIGTIAPECPLHTINATVNSSAATFQVDDNGTVPQQLLIRGNSDTNKQLIIGYNTTSDYGSIQAIFQGIGAKPFSLNPAGGNVGIGTIAPTTKLEIDNTTVNTSGVRLTRLLSTSPTTASSTPIGVNATGDIVTVNTNLLTQTAITTTSSTTAAMSANIIHVSGTITITLTALTPQTITTFVQIGVGAITFAGGTHVAALTNMAGPGAVVRVTSTNGLFYLSGDMS